MLERTIAALGMLPKYPIRVPAMIGNTQAMRRVALKMKLAALDRTTEGKSSAG
jgi:hypothetical protein